MDLAKEDPILLFVEGQTLLTQDVVISDGVTETCHYWPSNLHAWKLYGPSWGPRAIPGKLRTWSQGPFVTHHSRFMNPIRQDRVLLKVEKMARVLSQKPSFQHSYYASVQRRTSPIDDYFTSHVCGFCVTSFGLRSGSRSTHQATHQSFPAGMSGATQNCAQVGPSSCTFIFIETAIRIRVRYSWGNLRWRHFPKMADHENSDPASIGFSETALISSRIEHRAWQVGILERTHPTTTCGISFAGTSFPSEESTTVTGSRVDYCTRDCPSQPVQSGEDAVSSQVVKALPTGLGKSPGGHQRMFVHWNRNIRDIMRSHISWWIVETVKEAYTQADRDYDRVTAQEVRALSASWAYNSQLALPDILSAAFWRSSGVFQNSCLRDMACNADGM